MKLPEILRNRDFALYWGGVMLSEIGTRGTAAAVLFHVYLLSGSTLQVGFVGLAQAVALLLLSPLGGAVADRMDRRRLLQLAQLLSLTASLGLAIVTVLDIVRVWHILLVVLVNTSAVTFERPARDALIPALVPRGELIKAFSLVTPTREFAILLGPALAGFLMAVQGPEAMYLLDVVSYMAIITVLMFIRVPYVSPSQRPSVWSSITEGAAFLRNRPLILQFIGLDLVVTVFGAYRVLLPELSTDVLDIGAAGYGILSALPSAGALIGSAVIFRRAGRSGSGRVVLRSTAAYGLACLGLVWAGLLPGSGAVVLTAAAAVALGFFDAIATVVRQTVVQMETPDEIRGRVTGLYQMASRGGPSLGNLQMGWLASILGPVGALTLGGLAPIFVAGYLTVRGGRVREYDLPTHVAT